jgi:hypothetical protein
MLDILRSPELKLASQPEESEGDFKVRLIHAAHELRDRHVEKLRQSYGPKLSALQERIRRGEQRVEREEAQVGQQKIQTAISVGPPCWEPCSAAASRPAAAWGGRQRP